MFELPPWKHQALARERAKNLAYFALFFQMGTGKSRTAIDILRDKINAKKSLLKTIIFAPPIVLPNWKDEIGMYSKTPLDRVFILNASGKKRVQQFREAIASGPAIFVTNYESLLMEDLYKGMLRWQPEALIFDESHKLKNYKARRSKLAEALANPRGAKKPFCYLLSGSPVLNSPMDLFHQFLIMDGGSVFGKNFFVFRARYFIDKNAGIPKYRYFPDWRVAPGAVEEINKLIFKAGMRVTKDECLDLPEEVSVTIKCALAPAQKKNYDEMKRDLITFVGENPSSANLAIVKALRLMQITSGFLPLNPQGEEGDAAKIVYNETEKEENLRELLSELTPHSKVIVWAVWKENYGVIRRVCEELKIKCVEVHGGVSRAQQDANVAAFKSDPSIRVFLGHPGSGGIGINLTGAPYSIFYSRTFSLEHWLQARARNHRGGQTQKVTHYDLVCDGTIDAQVQKKLASKLQMSDNLLVQNIVAEMTRG